jgi:hypothetical protein
MIYKHKRDTVRVIPDPLNPIIVDLVGENFIDVLRAKDIGEGGLSVHVPYQFAGCIINREIELVITLPGARSFKAGGMIRHNGQKQELYFGISFTGTYREIVWRDPILDRSFFNLYNIRQCI